jgi:Bacterial archaeo-eukaryotic release factor family 3
VEEVPFPPGLVVSLSESMQTRKPDHVLDNRSFGGPSTGSMSGVLFGTGTDREHKDGYLLHFFAQLDTEVNSILRGSSNPLIVGGVDHEIALYGKVNTYPNLIQPGVYGATDGLERAEIHKRALELLERHSEKSGSGVPADFDKRVGTGRASAHVQEIIEAAWEGRVSHFFFQPSASYIGRFDPVRHRVRRTDDPEASPDDLIEGAAWQTILHGGIARILPASAMPRGVPVCALFRYSAPSKVVSASESRA